MPRNVDFVFGMDDAKPQTYMPAGLYLLVYMLALAIVFYLPTHLLLKRLCAARVRR